MLRVEGRSRVQLIRNLVQLIVSDPVSNETTRQLAYRSCNGEAGATAVEDSWERRIIELSDGRSVGEIKDALYREQLMAGAAVGGIGIWKNLFDQNVLNTICELADRGVIDLKSAEAMEEE